MTRKRHVIPALLAGLVLCATSALHAQGPLGFGIVIGEPTGIAWKYKLNYMNAIDGAIGFSPFDRFRIHADYLWHAHPFQEEHLAVHYGLGAVIGFGPTDEEFHHENLGFGARAVVGLTYTIPRSPVDTFVEIAPVVVAAPSPGIELDLGLGVRVYP